jgi:hypothetical protein
MGLILGVGGRMLVATGVGRGAMAAKKIEKSMHPGCNSPAAEGQQVLRRVM